MLNKLCKIYIIFLNSLFCFHIPSVCVCVCVCIEAQNLSFVRPLRASKKVESKLDSSYRRRFSNGLPVRKSTFNMKWVITLLE